MNMVPVTIDGKTAKASGFEVELPRAVGAGKAILGIRPEALTERTVEGYQMLDMKVEVVEVLGSDQYLFGKIGGDSITARVDPNLNVGPGDRVRLSLDPRRLHAFNPDDEKALL